MVTIVKLFVLIQNNSKEKCVMYFYCMQKKIFFLCYFNIYTLLFSYKNILC